MTTTVPAKTYRNQFLDASQDPIFDHANAVKVSVTTSVTVLTPAADCRFVRLSTDADCFVRTDGTDAADAAGSLRVLANQTETFPVTGGVDIKVYAPATAVVRVTPFKVRT